MWRQFDFFCAARSIYVDAAVSFVLCPFFSLFALLFLSSCFAVPLAYPFSSRLKCLCALHSDQANMQKLALEQEMDMDGQGGALWSLVRATSGLSDSSVDVARSLTRRM